MLYEATEDFSNPVVGLLELNASTTARVISGGDDENQMSAPLVKETGVPGGNHRPTASN